jgi:hypothetical protein
MTRNVQLRTRPWAFRPAREGDVDELVALHHRVFGKTISRQHWAWKLGERGPAANVWIAQADGRIVFQYAGIPVRFRHFGEDRWAMIDVDTMTDPDFRRQGLLTQGGDAAYSHWREAGIAFTVGLPNEQWGSRAVALGWIRVGALRWWVRWLDPIRMLGVPRSRSPRTLPGARLGRFVVARVFDAKQLEDLWELIAEEGVVRDAAWFRWRYLEGVPKWNVIGAWESGRLVGVAAFHLDRDLDLPSGLIGEVLGVSFEVLRVLLQRCCLELRGWGAVRAALLIQPGDVLEQAALATAFLPRPASFSVEAVDLGGGLPLAAHFQGGDFDVV